MTSLPPATLARATFRASANFELVAIDRLPPDEALPLDTLRRDPAFYGVLRPRGDHATVRAVDRDTALLWLTLREPGPVPRYVWSDDPQAAATGLAALVLDGVLDIEHDGAFVSGAAATAAVMERAASRGSGRLGHLSREALRWGEALLPCPATELAAQLYQFGRAPRGPAAARHLTGRPAVLDFIGAAGDAPLGRHLRRAWREGAAGELPWIAWSRADAAGEIPAEAPTFKLYVSPVLDDVPRAFEAVATLDRHRPWHFKIGADATGLLRPDKLVLYLPSLDALHETAAALAPRLEGVRPHGVPFTAEIAADGLLSWGLDPPRQARAVPWHAPESWRLWVVQRLAAAMSAATTSVVGPGPAAFAVERLRLDGVDVDGWTPSDTMWRH